MRQNWLYNLVFIVILGLIIFLGLSEKYQLNEDKIQEFSGKITEIDNNKTIITNEYNQSYTLKKKIKEDVGTLIKGKCVQNNDVCEVISYEVFKEDVPKYKGIFKDYYNEALDTLKNMTIEDKIKQVLLPHYNNNLSDYNYGGFVFFEKDFQNKTKDEVIKMIKNLQDNVKIPLLIAADEEGGTVTRISSNKNLVSEYFKSPQSLYKEGGFNKIKEDVLSKSNILESLGINLNLAPVVDVSTNPNDYIYKRTLGLDTAKVTEYAKVVIETSKNTSVSYTLKHFPGYGNNTDTHKGISIDNKSYEEILSVDIPPFESGIKAGAEAIMFSHNIIKCLDENNPASLSKEVHNLLTNNLNFTGVIITDDLNMDALKDIENKEVLALMAGNDLLITSNPEESYQNILDSINNKIISEYDLNNKVLKILSWKYSKGLF